MGLLNSLELGVKLVFMARIAVRVVFESFDVRLSVSGFDPEASEQRLFLFHQGRNVCKEEA
jgi:hypothetical protein